MSLVKEGGRQVEKEREGGRETDGSSEGERDRWK